MERERRIKESPLKKAPCRKYQPKEKKTSKIPPPPTALPPPKNANTLFEAKWSEWPWSRELKLPVFPPEEKSRYDDAKHAAEAPRSAPYKPATSKIDMQNNSSPPPEVAFSERLTLCSVSISCQGIEIGKPRLEL